ncbi:hypothetical protein Tco_0723023 [Tanacetum coccineum]
MITRPLPRTFYLILPCAQCAQEGAHLSREEVEEDDQERARFRDGKISLGRKKSQGSNIGDSGNTRDGGKTVGGAIGACGSGIGKGESRSHGWCFMEVLEVLGVMWLGEVMVKLGLVLHAAYSNASLHLHTGLRAHLGTILFPQSVGVKRLRNRYFSQHFRSIALQDGTRRTAA